MPDWIEKKKPTFHMPSVPRIDRLDASPRKKIHNIHKHAPWHHPCYQLPCFDWGLLPVSVFARHFRIARLWWFIPVFQSILRRRISNDEKPGIAIAFGNSCNAWITCASIEPEKYYQHYSIDHLSQASTQYHWCVTESNDSHLLYTREFFKYPQGLVRCGPSW